MVVDVDVRMVADTTGEHGAGMAGHSDAAAQHVAGGADGAPARTRPEYDHDGLESLVGFLSVTDSQRLRKAGGAAPDKERLAQRANAEEWRLRSEVPPPLLFMRLAPWRPREACVPAFPAGPRARLRAALSARTPCRRSRANGVCPVRAASGRKWRRSNG